MRETLNSQIAAVRTLTAIVSGAVKKPRASELDLLMKQAREAMISLQWLEQHEDRIYAAFGREAGRKY